LSELFRRCTEHKEGFDQEIDRHRWIAGFHFGNARLTRLEKLREFDLRESFSLAAFLETLSQSKLQCHECFFLWRETQEVTRGAEFRFFLVFFMA
jgi:hypothetical protein